MLTTRDLSVVDFLNYYKIASTSTIEQLIYKSKRVCQRRMKELVNEGKVKRTRASLNQEYIYYVKMPKQWKHSLLVTDFFREFSKTHDIVKFLIEPDFITMRPDAFFSYRQNGRTYIGFLEVELSHKGFDFAKYERFASEETYRQKNIPFMPPVFVIGNVKLPESQKVKYLKYELNTDI